VPPFNSTTDDGPASLPHQLPAADLEDNPNARMPLPRELMKKGLVLCDRVRRRCEERPEAGKLVNS
jgi:hypothetical protein